MGRKRINIIEKEKKYNMLTAIKCVGNEKGNELWECICDCGNISIKTSNNLYSLKIKSCGCMKNKGYPKHSLSNTRIYNIYEKMKSRCNNEKCSGYVDYGGRGISVCDDWMDSFVNFYNWSIVNGYSDLLTIDRINVDGNYSPNNCRWADMKTQQNNRRNNRKVSYNGIEKNVSQWAEEFGMPEDRLLMRLNNGWTVEDALLKPKMKNKKKEY